MVLGIPTLATIKEYNYLKSSQKEININSTSKNLDNYVYNKTHKFASHIDIGFLTLLNTAFLIALKKKWGAEDCSFVMAVANTFVIESLINNYNDRKYTLNNPKAKISLYKKNDINITA